MVATQEKVVEVAALLQLTQGRNRSMWTMLPAVEVAVVGIGYALITVDTELDY